MHARLRLLPLLSVSALVGCGNPTVQGGASDAALGPDSAVAADLAPRPALDGAPPDLPGDDLAPGADSATPPDLSPSLDLTGTVDLIPPPDLVTPPDLAVPIKRSFDVTGVIGTGQSLSVGAVGTPVVSTKQPYANLKLTDPNFTGNLAGPAGMGATLAPLIEPMRPNNPKFPGGPAYPNNLYGETPHPGMANQISALALAAENKDFSTVHSAVGESGQSITVIRKNGTGNSFAAALYEARAIAALAKQAGKTFGVGAITLTHGETDSNDMNYEAEIHQLWMDYNQDLSAITGQAQKIPILVTQQGSFPGAPGTSLSTLAQWKMGLDYPGDLVCAGPKYQYEYAQDHVHLTANGYRRLGEKYGEVFYQAVMLGQPWKPLQPNAATVNGKVITVTFDVPVPPLRWDSRIPPPHQSPNHKWSAGRGFEAADKSGDLKIAQVDLVAADTVQITLDQPSMAGGLTVGYAMTQDVQGYAAGTASGRQGQLRDSDTTAGYDGLVIPCAVVAGSKLISALGIPDFSSRSVLDVAVSPSLPDDTVIQVKNANNAVTLSSPWAGPTGNVGITFQNDLHNYCVQFFLAVK